MIFAEDPITHRHPDSAEHTLHPSLVEEVEEGAVHWFHRVVEWWHIAAEVLLGIRIIMEIWEVAVFFLYEYAELTDKLALHVVTQEEIDVVLARAVVNSLFAIINILLTVRLHKLKGTIASTLDLLAESTLLIASPLAEAYVQQAHIVSHIANWIFSN